MYLSVGPVEPSQKGLSSFSPPQENNSKGQISSVILSGNMWHPHKWKPWRTGPKISSSSSRIYKDILIQHTRTTPPSASHVQNWMCLKKSRHQASGIEVPCMSKGEQSSNLSVSHKGHKQAWDSVDTTLTKVSRPAGDKIWNCSTLIYNPSGKA